MAQPQGLFGVHWTKTQAYSTEWHVHFSVGSFERTFAVGHDWVTRCSRTEGEMMTGMDDGNGSVGCPQGLQCVFHVEYWLGKIKRPSFNRARSFPSGLDGKESVCNAGDLGSFPGSGRSAWRRAWQPSPVFMHENTMDRGVWRATAVGLHKVPNTTERLTLFLFRRQKAT